MSARDERDRLRELVQAMAAHGTAAMRVEVVIPKEGAAKFVVTHSGGKSAEQVAAFHIASFLHTLGFKSGPPSEDNVKPFDDVPGDAADDEPKPKGGR